MRALARELVRQTSFELYTTTSLIYIPVCVTKHNGSNEQAEGVSPDVVTTTTLVKAQVANGDMRGAMASLVEMLKESKLKNEMDAFPFNTIIQVRKMLQKRLLLLMYNRYIF